MNDKTDGFVIPISITGLVSIAVCFVLLLITIIVISLGKKKNKVSNGKKAISILLIILTSASFILTTLIQVNVIPLAIRPGYYMEVGDFNNDGLTSGLKITMEGKVGYIESVNASSISDSNVSKKGDWYLSLDMIYINYENDSDGYIVKQFGKDLYHNNVLCYKFVKPIEVKH